jgi:hypothetical protein
MHKAEKIIMVFEYVPTCQVIIDGIVLQFGESRELIRRRLGGTYSEDNLIIHLGGSETDVIHQRRDIYVNLNLSENHFFLGYNNNDLLSEVELHFCDKIKVLHTQFGFEDDLNVIAPELSAYSPIVSQKEGEYFFKELQLVVSDKIQMGGEGHTLGYFYCASDVKHLE